MHVQRSNDKTFKSQCIHKKKKRKYIYCNNKSSTPSLEAAITGIDVIKPNIAHRTSFVER